MPFSNPCVSEQSQVASANAAASAKALPQSVQAPVSIPSTNNSTPSGAESVDPEPGFSKAQPMFTRCSAGEEWEVQMPVEQVPQEVAEGVLDQHHHVSVTLLKLCKDVEIHAQDKDACNSLASLIREQSHLKESLEVFLVQGQGPAALGLVRALNATGSMSEAPGVSLTGEVQPDTFLHTRTVSLPEVKQGTAYVEGRRRSCMLCLKGPRLVNGSWRLKFKSGSKRDKLFMFFWVRLFAQGKPVWVREGSEQWFVEIICRPMPTRMPPSQLAV